MEFQLRHRLFTEFLTVMHGKRDYMDLSTCSADNSRCFLSPAFPAVD